MSRKRRLWTSSITQVRRNQLVTWGVNQEDLIRTFSYEEMVFLLVLGRRPTDIEARMLRHVILSHCSHGITGQSTLAVRMGADTGASFLHAAIGGFSVGSGSYHQGGLERAMMEVSMAQKSGDPEKYTREKLARNEILYGFGHRFQTRDVRARLLMRLCEEYSFLQDHVACVKVMDVVMGEEKGVHMNIEAAGGSILLDLGFPTEVAALIILIGRGPMFAAAYMERLNELRCSGKFFPKISVYEELLP